MRIVDTGVCSHWKESRPVLLPLVFAKGSAGSHEKKIELEVSLWEKSGDIARMYDAVAEVVLPPYGQLATSEQTALER